MTKLIDDASVPKVMVERFERLDGLCCPGHRC